MCYFGFWVISFLWYRFRNLYGKGKEKFFERETIVDFWVIFWKLGVWVLGLAEEGGFRGFFRFR